MNTTPRESSEAARLQLQKELDTKRSAAERNEMGQFATPPGLALELVRAGVELLGNETPIRFIDPAIGTGAFYSALLALRKIWQIEAATGFEIDPHFAGPATRLWHDTPLMIRCADFTEAEVPDGEEARFNLVVCNPPYVRHHHIENGRKRWLQEAFADITRTAPSGLMGLYGYFLILAHKWMADSGVGAWLVPSEFMDVRYGQAIKCYLLERVELIRIHRFLPEDVQFGDALVSSAIVLFRKSKARSGHEVRFSLGGTLSQPALSRVVSLETLRSELKWTRFPEQGERSAHSSGLTLGDLFEIKRGIATGDNRFFILSHAEIRDRKLPKECFRVILPSPRHLLITEIEADEDGSPAIDKKLYVLDCDLPEPDIRSKYPSLWEYLKTGVPKVSETFLCRHRKRWYAQEKRSPAPLLSTYMGRKRHGARPFRFFLNHSQAIAPNVYLMMYPKPVLSRTLRQRPEVLRKVWEYLNAYELDRMLREGRVYGGGLYKLEPKELAALPVEDLADLLTVRPTTQSDQQVLFSE